MRFAIFMTYFLGTFSKHWYPNKPRKRCCNPEVFSHGKSCVGYLKWPYLDLPFVCKISAFWSPVFLGWILAQFFTHKRKIWVVVSNILYFHPENWGFMIQFDECAYFFKWVETQPPTRDPGLLEGLVTSTFSSNFPSAMGIFAAHEFARMLQDGSQLGTKLRGVEKVTQTFRWYLKWRDHPHLYKPYGYGLCKGRPTPKIAENKVQETIHFRYLKFLVKKRVASVWVFFRQTNEEFMKLVSSFSFLLTHRKWLNLQPFSWECTQ